MNVFGSKRITKERLLWARPIAMIIKVGELN